MHTHKLSTVKNAFCSLTTPVKCGVCGNKVFRNRVASSVVIKLIGSIGLIVFILLFMHGGKQLLLSGICVSIGALLITYAIETLYSPLLDYTEVQGNEARARGHRNAVYFIFIILFSVIIYAIDKT